MRRLLALIVAAAAATALMLSAGVHPALAEPTVGLLQLNDEPGGTVLVSGRGFDPGRIELRWDGSDGTQLATAEGPDFRAQIVIPPASPGTHTLVVFTRDANGVIGSSATSSIEVSASVDGAGASTGQGGSPPTTQPASSIPPEKASSATWAVVVGGLAILGVVLILFRRYRPRRSG